MENRKRRKILCDPEWFFYSCVSNSEKGIPRISDHGEPRGFSVICDQGKRGNEGGECLCKAECGEIWRDALCTLV